MKIHCPHCGVNGSADDLYHGLKVKCPKCQGIFVAAGDIAPAPPPPPTPVETLAEEPAATGNLAGPEAPGEAGDAGPAAAEPVADGKAEVAEEIESIMEPIIEPVVEPEEVPAWSDIAPEIDKTLTEEDKRLEGAESPVSPDSPDDDERRAVAAPDPQNEEGENTAAAVSVADGVERQPYGVDQEQCWQCGKKDGLGVPFVARDGRLYCPDCMPAEDEAKERTAVPDSGIAEDDDDFAPEGRSAFTIGGALREAWEKTRGAKGPVWAGTAVMYLVLLAMVAGGSLLMPSGMGGFVGETIFLLIINAVAMVFTGGLLLMGIRRVAGQSITWNMVFRGFSMTQKIVVATILQSLLIGIGFLLLVLPGIYLAIGYAMTIPLIIDRRMSPWQAMEASRKAVHREWWKIAGLFLVMTLIINLSMVPLGIGLIWSWPMFIILAGVVYRSLFGFEKSIG